MRHKEGEKNGKESERDGADKVAKMQTLGCATCAIMRHGATMPIPSRTLPFRQSILKFWPYSFVFPLVPGLDQVEMSEAEKYKR